MAFGWKMVAMSPDRRAIESRMEEQEADAQRIQKELFQRYGK
jgi:tetrahydromethanopterin S-methyltransferase subunit G